MKLTEYHRWSDVPDGLKTKTTLEREGLRVAKGQRPIAVKISFGKRYSLYDENEAVPKRVMTEAQAAALEKARVAAIAARTCAECGFVDSYNLDTSYGRPLCESCRHDCWLEKVKNEAIHWSKRVLETDGVLILDTETTGLDGEIIEIAVIDMSGNEILNTRLNPISKIEPDATAVHGLTAEMLASEPSFGEIYQQLSQILTSASLVIIYNAAFDVARLSHTCRLHGRENIAFKYSCAMNEYSVYCGEWHNYYQSFTWQRLPSGDHTAVGDCRATLEVVRRMAAQE